MSATLGRDNKSSVFPITNGKNPQGDMELIDSRSCMNNPALQNVNNKCFGTVTIKIFIFIEINPTQRNWVCILGEGEGE